MLDELTFKKFLTIFAALVLIAISSLILSASIIAESPKLIIVVIGASIGALILFIKTDLLIYGLLFTACYLVGFVSYFFGLKQFSWLIYGLSFVLYIKVFLIYLNSKSTLWNLDTPLTNSVFVLFVLFIVSSLLNKIDLLQLLVASKNYIFIWSLFFLISYSVFNIKQICKIFDLLKYLIWFQVPLILYQAFIIVPTRENSIYSATSHDAITGGFGGDPMGGSASGTLAMFTIINLIFNLSLFKRKLIGFKELFFILLPTFIILVLAEVKVIILLIPISLFLLYFKTLKKNPFKFVLSSVCVITTLFTILIAYEIQYSTNETKQLDISASLERVFIANFDDEHKREHTGELGRATIFKHWWQENGFEFPINTIIGHGPGATRISPLQVGEVAKKYYYFQMSRTGAARILWELGFAGLFIYSFILIKGSYISYSAMISLCFNEKQKASIETTYIALILLFITIPYSIDMIEIPALSVLTVFLLGFSVMLNRIMRQKENTI